MNLSKIFKTKRTIQIWFAWYPVKCEDNQIRWLENLYRYPVYADGFFMYYTYRPTI